MICYVHKALLPYCSFVTSHALATGMGNTLGNKGAVCVYLEILNIKILVVTAHLSAHQGAVETRNNEFHKINQIIAKEIERKIQTSKDSANVIIKEKKIITSDEKNDEKLYENDSTTIDDQNNITQNQSQEKNFSSSSSSDDLPSNNQIEKEEDEDDDEDFENENENPYPDFVPDIPNHSDTKLKNIADVVIFMGDLNYRVNGNRSILDKCLLDDMYSVLLNNDQLK